MCFPLLRTLEKSGRSPATAPTSTTPPGFRFEALVFGDPDHLLRVIARDLSDFQRLYDERLSGLPGVRRLTSTLVMKSIVEDAPLPL